MAVIVKLKQIREERGLTQEALARVLGMSLGGVQKIERGKVKAFSTEALNGLCKTLHCQPGDLLVYIPDEDEELTNAS